MGEWQQFLMLQAANDNAGCNVLLAGKSTNSVFAIMYMRPDKAPPLCGRNEQISSESVRFLLFTQSLLTPAVSQRIIFI